MTIDPPVAPSASIQLEGIAEVARLTNLLADRVAGDHMADRPIPDAHLSALSRAAQLLDEYGQEVPPLLAPIMDQLRARAASQGDPEPASISVAGDL